MSIDAAAAAAQHATPTLAARGLLAHLEEHADDQGWLWDLSTEEVGRAVGCSGRTIIRYLNQLEAAGMIQRRLVARGSRPSHIRVVPNR